MRLQKQTFQTTKGPEAKGPYNTAVRFGPLIFVSGQGPVDPETGKMVGETVEEQTHRTIQNVQLILDEMGSGLAEILKTTVYLRDMNDFAKMNAIYAEYFGPDFPARTTIQAGRLPFDIHIEIDVIAGRPLEV